MTGTRDPHDPHGTRDPHDTGDARDTCAAHGTDDRDRVLERFHLIANGPALFNAVVAGAELGVFTHLSRHPKSSFDEVRAALGLPAHQLRVLLFALCTTELIRRDGGAYRNTPVAEDFFASGGEDDWGDILAGWQRIYYPAFAHLTEALRSGENTALAAYPGSEPTLYQRLEHRPELQEVLHRSMTAFTLRSMSGIVDHLDLAGVEHVLDVGGGDGTTAKALAAAHPGVRFTVFDVPGVAEIGSRRMAGPLADRVALHPGDIFLDPFPRDAQCVLFSHCLEVFDGDQILALLTKAFDALPPGGRVAVYGYHAADDEQRGLYGARLSLYLNVLATGQGMAYPADDYERWLGRAGFVDVGTVADLPYEHGLVTGVRP
ncbi:methyltransferase [Kitasatospora sp. NPDC059577]|uniref:methyltransferase n=1 Tax=Kitasatospora sp. NPDC059577 TaxID=3346873 RepID=UPI0036B508E0